MENINLLFSKNQSGMPEAMIKKKLKFREGMLCYSFSVKRFNGDHVWELLSVINYVKKTYGINKVPIKFNLGKIEFEDKLVYILLETICYHFFFHEKRIVRIDFHAIHTIWTEGISFSPMINMQNMDLYERKFKWDISGRHFRRVVPTDTNSEYLSELMQDIENYLRNNGIKPESVTELSEVVTELIANALEHSNTECLVDLDITEDSYVKTGCTEDEGVYYGLNVVVLNYSDVLFYETLKSRLENENISIERYKVVQQAKEYHEKHFNQTYGLNEFYTISSFQHKISGRKSKRLTGGTGLTSLIRSLAEKADSNLCYMLSGNKVLFFRPEYTRYDENKWIGFNRRGNYMGAIPDDDSILEIKTFFPGTAYNLNFAIKKEWTLA